MPYRIAGMSYRVLRNRVERFSVLINYPRFFQLGGCETRYFFELSGEMRYAAVSQLIGDLAQSVFIVEEQFLHLLNFLSDDILFECDAFYTREKIAEVIILIMHFI